MKKLFIGGTMNGKWLDVDDNMRRILIPVPEIFDRVYDDVDFKKLELKTEAYKLETIIGNSEAFTMYVFESITPDKMIELLIHNYNPKQ